MQVSKLILAITGDRKVLVWHDVNLSAEKSSRLKELARGFGHVSEVAFTMCGNPNKVISTDNLPQLTFRFISPE